MQLRVVCYIFSFKKKCQDFEIWTKDKIEEILTEKFSIDYQISESLEKSFVDLKREIEGE